MIREHLKLFICIYIYIYMIREHLKLFVADVFLNE